MPIINIKIGEWERNIDKYTSKETVSDIKSSGAPNSIYASYKWNDKIMFCYTTDKPKVALTSLDGRVIMNGVISIEPNGLPVSFVDFHSDSLYSEEVSVISSTVISSIASNKKDVLNYPILNKIHQELLKTEESNPVLVFYKIKF